MTNPGNKSELLRRAFVEGGKALVEDGISFVGLPVSTLKLAVVRLMPKELRPDFYLSPNEQLMRALYDSSRLNYLNIKNGIELHTLPVAIEFDNSLRAFSPNEIKVSFSDKTFTLDDELEAAAAHFFGSYRRMLRAHRKCYTDGELARLKCVSSDEEGVKLCIQPVRYNAVCKTHMCLDAPIKDKGDTIRNRVHGKSKGLEDLASSKLANSLGVNTLLFTADGELIIQKRSRKVVAFGSLWGAPSSGSFEADDFRLADGGSGTFPFLRESKEELHIHNEDINPDSVKFLGITRELLRGGKPEMFFMAQTNLDQGKVRSLRRNAKDKWESSKLIFWHFGGDVFNDNPDDDQKYVFRKNMDALLNKHADSMSLPLLSALALWQKNMQIQ